jgi:hypothetical protein
MFDMDIISGPSPPHRRGTVERINAHSPAAAQQAQQETPLRDRCANIMAGFMAQASPSPIPCRPSAAPFGEYGALVQTPTPLRAGSNSTHHGGPSSYLYGGEGDSACVMLASMPRMAKPGTPQEHRCDPEPRPIASAPAPSPPPVPRGLFQDRAPTTLPREQGTVYSHVTPTGRRLMLRGSSASPSAASPAFPATQRKTASRLQQQVRAASHGQPSVSPGRADALLLTTSPALAKQRHLGELMRGALFDAGAVSHVSPQRGGGGNVTVFDGQPAPIGDASMLRHTPKPPTAARA